MNYTKFFTTTTIIVTILTAVATVLMMAVWRKERYDVPETIVRVNGKITVFSLRILEVAIFYDALILIVKLIIE